MTAAGALGAAHVGIGTDIRMNVLKPEPERSSSSILTARAPGPRYHRRSTTTLTMKENRDGG